MVGHHQTDPYEQRAEAAGVGVAAGSVAIGGITMGKQSGRAEPGGRQAASRHGITAARGYPRAVLGGSRRAILSPGDFDR